MINDSFKTKEELFEIFQALNINYKEVKRVRTFPVNKMLIKFKDGHSANFIIKQENKNEIHT